jgi:hypothetical protein
MAKQVTLRPVGRRLWWNLAILAQLRPVRRILFM